MDNLYAIFGWGSPIGTGVFLVFLGCFIFLISKANKNKKKE